MATIPGIHHITAISGPAQANVDFYAGVLGLRFVKKTINFDDPGTYHLYYGDYPGRPGTLLTFFPWANAVQGRPGPGTVTTTAFSVPAGSLDYWQARLAEHGVDTQPVTERFGQPVLSFADPDGMSLTLVAHTIDEADDQPPRALPAEVALRSFHSATLCVPTVDRTARLLTETFGYEEIGEEQGRLRYAAPGEARASILDLYCDPALTSSRMGAGSVHHIAFRARDDEEQQAWRTALVDLGFHVTSVKDRQYFRSIYFREPGGVLFEIATDGPGFARDEALGALGTHLKLPPWLESRRDDIEQRLPDLTIPTTAS
ncbi:MAG: ring-cleaving dioxygenase [Bacteroidetes bacterium]|jgi:glyoxalase family protein|nr:ring-cleaving dioxygenase [Bacteroidota bacterium]